MCCCCRSARTASPRCCAQYQTPPSLSRCVMLQIVSACMCLPCDSAVDGAVCRFLLFLYDRASVCCSRSGRAASGGGRRKRRRKQLLPRCERLLALRRIPPEPPLCLPHHAAMAMIRMRRLHTPLCDDVISQSPHSTITSSCAQGRLVRSRLRSIFFLFLFC